MEDLPGGTSSFRRTVNLQKFNTNQAATHPLSEHSKNIGMNTSSPPSDTGTGRVNHINQNEKFKNIFVKNDS